MPITGYVIERKEVSRGGWTTAGMTDSYSTSIKVSKLLEGNSYDFRVMAENKVGTGPPLETTQTVEVKSPFDVPDAPSKLEAVEVTANSITLEWREPRSDGGAPIRTYIVQRKQGYSGRFIRVSRAAIRDTYFRDNNVYEDADYEYRVAAENEAGEGAYSEETGPVRAKDPFDIPAAPGRPEVSSVTGSSVSLTWPAPRTDGGSPITNYNIEYKASTGYKWQTANLGYKVSQTFSVKTFSYDVEVVNTFLFIYNLSGF